MRCIRSLWSWARRPRRHRGQALVEFALILPIFFMLLAGTLDLGRVAYAQITVTNAAREGAMEAAHQAGNGAISYVAGQPCDTSTNTVMCRVQLESRDSWVSIQPSDVNLTCNPSCTSGIGNMVTVSVTGHMTLITPLLAGFFGGNTDISFAQSSTAQIETLPPPGPTPVPTATPTPTPTPSPSPTPTATLPPACPAPSAGFTYSVQFSGSGNSDKAPATITVTDTSTPTVDQYPGCEVNYWYWDWGDGTIGSGQDPGTHTYTVPGTYIVKLTVNSPFSNPNTTGGVTIKVKS